MRNIVLTLLSVFCSLSLLSDDGFVFKVIQNENKTYRMTMHTVSENKVDYNASEEILALLREKGVEFPMRIKQEQITAFSNKLGKKQPDGKIPFIGRLDSISIKQYRNDKVQNIPSKQIDTSFRMNGYYQNGGIVLTDVSGKGIDSSMKDIFKEMMSQTLKSIKFPEKPITIGESFSQTIPLSIPVQGMAAIKMLITTSYKLKSLDPRFANFDVALSYQLTTEMDSTTVALYGHGDGAMSFDRIESQMVSLRTNSLMRMSVRSGPIIIVTESHSDSEVITSITNNEYQ